MMKKYIFLAIFLLKSLTFFAQTAETLIEEGVMRYQEGDFEGAKAKYQEVLKQDKMHPEANYELALVYSTQSDFKSAIKHVDLVIKSKASIAYMAYALKGACQDYMGTPKAAIKSFKKGIALNDQYQPLYYSLGLTSLKLNQFKEAELALIQSLYLDAFHANSHFLLGLLKADQNNNTQAMLAFLNFLILEPEGERAKQAFEIIKEIQGNNIKLTTAKEINININAFGNQSEFSFLDFMLPLMKANAIVEAQDNVSETPATPFEKFSNHNKKVLQLIAENKKDKQGFWWDFYVDFFKDIVNDEEIFITFSNHIGMVDPSFETTTWLEENSLAFEKFRFWIQSYNRITQ